MKFLGWMHRKLMPNGKEPNKNSTIGNISACFSVHTLFNEQNCYKVPTKTMACPNIRCQKSSDIFEANEREMISREESLEPFDFLAIGTFGMELRHTDPPTPTLTTPHENWTYPQTEITENDLELVNYELEKFLEAGEKEIAYDTSGRSSQASIITLSHAIPEGADSDSQVHTMAHPLQNYLFATLIDRTETDEGVTKEKTAPRGHFKENNMTHDKHTKIREGSEQRSRKVSHFMKKMVKKFNSSSRCSKDSSKKDAAISISIKKRLSKAIKKFDRKVRPEEMTDKQFTKVEKNAKKRISGEHENKMIGQDRSKWSGKETREPSSNGTYMGASTTNGEHWIKTDSDYLVLEL